MNAAEFYARFEPHPGGGGGGMGEVRIFREKALDRLVAIKRLRPELMKNENARLRLEREAQALAALKHPNIVAVHYLEVLPPPDGPQVVMEYVEGENLAQRLATPGGPLDVRETARVGAQIAFALEAAHAKGFVHRDLKPGNVMLTPTGIATLVDFGLAARSEPADPDAPTALEPILSTARQILGTPGYMSPEQWMGRVLDPRADLWALGCVLFECLAGARAFRGTTEAELMAATLTQDPSFSSLPPAVPVAMRHLLARCLTKQIDLRTITAADARGVLESIAEGASPGTPRAESAGRALPNNLPRDATSFVGRRHELRQLHRLLKSQRLVTISGLNGFGKSRLLRRLAHNAAAFCERVVLIDLCYVTDPAQVSAETARVLSARPRAGEDAIEAAIRALGVSRVLVLFDHCEAVVGECGTLAGRLLSACPGVTVVVANGRALEQPGEQCFPLGPMACPAPAAGFSEIRACESVQLLVDRVRLKKPEFRLTAENAESLAGICRHFDGVPVAIELAAQLLRSRSPSELLDFLKREPGPHRDALGRAFAASYDLLTDSESRALRRVAVFRDGWTLAAAERVVAQGGDTALLMDGLVDASLASVNVDGAMTRYRLLESIRILSLAELQRDPAEETAARDRHLEYFLAAADKLEHDVLTGIPVAVTAVALERENIRAALRHAACERVDAGRGLRLATAVYRFWYLIGQYDEGMGHLESALQRYGDVNDAAQAAGLNALGILALGARDLQKARDRFTRSMEISRSLGDIGQVAGRLSNLGIVEEHRGHLGEARTRHERALELYVKITDPTGAAKARLNLGVIAHLQERLEEARGLYEQSLTDFDQLGDRHRAAIVRHNLGELEWALGNYVEAARLLAQSRRMRCDMMDWPGMVYTLRWEAFVAEKRGLHRLAALGVGVAAATESWKDCRGSGDPPEPVSLLTARLAAILSADGLAKVLEECRRPSQWDRILEEIDGAT